MAKVKIQGNASGTGVLTVTAPNTSTDRTITLPDSTGTLATTADSVGGANGVDFNDNVKAQFGTGNDLQIYHDGSNSYIRDAGDGDIHIRSDAGFRVQNAGGTENYIYAESNGKVRLYHNNITKLDTTSTGVTVTGAATAVAAAVVLVAQLRTTGCPLMSPLRLMLLPRLLVRLLLLLHNCLWLVACCC